MIDDMSAFLEESWWYMIEEKVRSSAAILRLGSGFSVAGASPT
jgi:hypothetical protein